MNIQILESLGQHDDTVFAPNLNESSWVLQSFLSDLQHPLKLKYCIDGCYIVLFVE